MAFNNVNQSNSSTDVMKKLRNILVPASFLVIPLILYGVWVVYPTLSTFGLSMTDWDGLGKTSNFVGLKNFTDLFKDDAFKKALTNNLIWILIFISVPTSAGLALAITLNRSLRFDRFLKIAFYLPLILALVVAGLIWDWLYNPTAGLVNSILSLIIGKKAFDIGWLGDPKMALYSILGTAIWRQVGYVMILYLAGLKTVDAEVLEAARVDGAEGWSLFRYMIFPMLAPVTTIVVVISIIDSLRSFDLVNIMTRGGPFHSSEVLANYMYISAFNDYRFGYAAAIAVVLFCISLVFIFIYLRQVIAQEEAGS
jgi:ABC-type sugar transport system permease subunit